MSREFGAKEIESVKEFADLFFRSRYYVRVQMVLADDEIQFATGLPGYEYWVGPITMMDGRPDSDGTARWKPIPSPIDENLIRRIESFLGAKLPPLFKCYLCASSMLAMDLVVGTLPDIDPRRPLSWLEWCINTWPYGPFNSDPRYVPFTLGPAFASYLWFDVANPDQDGDYPIIQTMERSSEIATSEKVFDSFAEYFEHLKLWMKFTQSGLPDHVNIWIQNNPLKNPPASYFS